LPQYIDTVSYSQNQDVINRLAAIVRDVSIGGWIVTIFLALVAGLVIFNTIRLAIYSNREEIGVMRVVGASNSLVRGPFVVEGMLWGLIAAVISLILFAPALYFVSPYLSEFGIGIDVFQYFYTHIIQLFVYELLFGVVIGGLSSFWAVRRYLKN
jgi:cell division transport system permease protein